MVDETQESLRRTRLANERTWLAWVRTGMTATAVALAIGRLVPEVADVGERWPFALLGAGYGLLGVALVVYGYRRNVEVDRAAAGGEEAPDHSTALGALVVAIIVLGLGVTALAVVG